MIFYVCDECGTQAAAIYGSQSFYMPNGWNQLRAVGHGGRKIDLCKACYETANIAALEQKLKGTTT